MVTRPHATPLGPDPLVVHVRSALLLVRPAEAIPTNPVPFSGPRVCSLYPLLCLLALPALLTSDPFLHRPASPSSPLVAMPSSWATFLVPPPRFLLRPRPTRHSKLCLRFRSGSAKSSSSPNPSPVLQSLPPAVSHSQSHPPDGCSPFSSGRSYRSPPPSPFLLPCFAPDLGPPALSQSNIPEDLPHGSRQCLTSLGLAPTTKATRGQTFQTPAGSLHAKPSTASTPQYLALTYTLIFDICTLCTTSPDLSSPFPGEHQYGRPSRYSRWGERERTREQRERRREQWRREPKCHEHVLDGDCWVRPQKHLRRPCPEACWSRPPQHHVWLRCRRHHPRSLAASHRGHPHERVPHRLPRHLPPPEVCCQQFHPNHRSHSDGPRNFDSLHPDGRLPTALRRVHTRASQQERPAGGPQPLVSNPPPHPEHDVTSRATL